jgi:transposase
MGTLGFDTSTRHQLEEILKHPPSALQLKRAQSLLWADDGELITQAAARLRTTRQSVHNWIHWITQRTGPIAERLLDAPRSGRPRDKSAVVDDLLPHVLAKTPLDYGYRAYGWTNPLLRDYLKRHYQVTVSRYTIQQAIKRAGYRWKRPRYMLARCSPTWRQAKGGLKCGLKERKRTVILMADATILTEVPPLRACYAPIGKQAVVAITGTHNKRVIFGALNIKRGYLELLITTHWEALTWQAFLQQIRGVWHGWRIVLFCDRGSPHTAVESREVAQALGIELRFLPVAMPELNALEGLWRHGKDQHLANRSIESIDDTADALCRYLLDLSPRQRLKMAGVLSGKFWLTR